MKIGRDLRFKLCIEPWEGHDAQINLLFNGNSCREVSEQVHSRRLLGDIGWNAVMDHLMTRDDEDR